MDNAVSTVGAQRILDACATTGTTFCSLIERNSGGVVTELFNGLVNLGGQTTSGFDYNVAYNFETEYGDFRVNWDGTYVDERTSIFVDPVTGESISENDAGKAFDRDVIPRIRTNLSYHDASVGYSVTENLRLTFGVNNLWDADPEVSYTTFANSFDPSMYEIPGRFFYGRINVDF